MYRALLLAVATSLAPAPWLASASIAAPAMSAPAPAMPVPAATAMPFPAYVPFKAPKPASIEELNRATGGQSNSVQTFDTAGRAQVIARELPRVWNGSYQGFASGAAVPVQLKLSGAKAIGQVVELRGDISIEGVSSPVQGTISAESDQLDLLVLGNQLGGGLQPGGSFQGAAGAGAERLERKPAYRDGRSAIPEPGGQWRVNSSQQRRPPPADSWDVVSNYRQLIRKS